MESTFTRIEAVGAQSCTLYSYPSAGLRALLVVDSSILGPGVGGIRTWAYSDVGEALEDGLRLARAMTIKCALAGLDAGGAKMVVIDHPGLNRRAAFEWLGRRIEELGGAFLTAGDLGTRQEDLEAMARVTRFVHTNEENLSGAVGETVLQCLLACAEQRGLASLKGLSVAVQGCGSIGTAVARKLAENGIHLHLADIDAARAQTLARELGAATIGVESVLTSDVDIIAPCAKGGVIDAMTARKVSAWAVCGGANNILADAEVEDVLMERGVLFVPDVLSSSGAVIAGIASSVMGLSDHSALLHKIGERTRIVLKLARSGGKRSSDIAWQLAMQSLADAVTNTNIV